ncbi:Polymerase beta nucleotidyltransferase domain-containing protein [Candidatus Magnetomoraceae bacterium gMMP-15]
MEITNTLAGQLKNIVSLLNKAKIDYALAGGLAFSALVEPQSTMHIDILIMITERDILKFFSLIEDNFESLIIHDEPMQFKSTKIWRVVSFIKSKEIIFDFLLAETDFHKNAIKRAQQLDFLDFKLRIISIEDLIILKKIAKRPQDIADLDRIYTILKNEIDHDYVKIWSKLTM